MRTDRPEAAPSGSIDDGRRDDEPLARGARVGRYEIVDRLGAGGMGTVYAAHDPALDRKIALKLIRARVAGPALEARLLHEAKAMARLSHPEVIAVHDAGRDGEWLFIAMDLVDGGTLREWLLAAPRTWREILAVFLRAGKGLAQAHAAGIVHRDFKPDNVLIGRDGRVRVTDFGLARAAGDDVESARDAGASDDARSVAASMLTRTGALVGTPAYMAPEQLRGGAADARSDVFGFAVSLYEALYGERPFDGATIAALRSSALEGRVRPPPAGKRVPARLRRAILVGLRASPAERYASMADMLDAIERAARFPRAWSAGIVAVVAIGGAFALGSASRRVPAADPSASARSSAPIASANAAGCSPRACSASHGNAPYACRRSDGACVAIESEDCAARFEPGDLEADDTVWLGAMFPTKGPAAEGFGNMNAAGADFARREIAAATLDARASKRVRRIALVTCDDQADPSRAARHLADDVGVPAVLGFGSGQTLVELAGSILVGRRVVSVASLTTSPLITRVPQPTDLPRMVWRTTYSIEDLSEVTARFVHDVLEPRLATPGRRTRVALARVDMSAGLWFGEAFYRKLVFNGKPALDNGADYQEIVIPPRTATRARIGELADRIARAEPTVLVLLGDTEVTTPLIEAVEARWRGPAPRPTYVVGDNSTEELASFIGRSADRRHRVLAITSVSSDAPTARFVARYNAAHAAPVTRTFSPAVTYDAFYLLAYATFALGDGVIDGVSLARAFARLVPPGRAIEVGPNGVLEGISALAAGERIDLRGASMALDFDLATGEAPSDFALVCPDVGADGGVSGDLESGVYYRAATHTIEGSIRCP